MDLSLMPRLESVQKFVHCFLICISPEFISFCLSDTFSFISKTFGLDKCDCKPGSQRFGQWVKVIYYLVSVWSKFIVPLTVCNMFAVHLSADFPKFCSLEQNLLSIIQLSHLHKCISPSSFCSFVS